MVLGFTLACQNITPSSIIKNIFFREICEKNMPLIVFYLSILKKCYVCTDNQLETFVWETVQTIKAL